MLDISLFARTLQARDEVSEAECNLLAELPGTEKVFAKGEAIVEQFSEPSVCTLLHEGLAGREILMEDGGRQIAALHVPGDFVDLHSLLLKRMDHGVIALTKCRVAVVPHDALSRLVEDAPHLGRLLWLMTLIDGAIQRQWTASMGRRLADKHIAHLICETYARLDIVGLVGNNEMQIPLTQSVLADFLGLSTVHVNRTLRAVNAGAYVSWHHHHIEILDRAALEASCDFDATYLNLCHRPR